MSELRLDPTTREWVIMAPERLKRPQQTLKKVPTEGLPERDEACPFCPGNEDQTPEAVFVIPSSDRYSEWDVRVVPNRFAALTMDENNLPVREGPLNRGMPGLGVHEVIIDNPSHNTTIAMMSYQQVENLLAAYQQRYNTLKKEQHLKSITIFKNHGRESGTSLAHPHSQLIATPIITPYYHRRFDVAVDYYSDVGNCLYCDILNEELKNKERIVTKTEDFVVFHPYASRSSYETWIIPRAHYSSFGLFPEGQRSGLAVLLKDILLCLYRGLNDPAYNLMIDTSVTTDEENPYYHWHIRIVPRLSMIAGFEMGSGIYINTMLPEDSAKSLRDTAQSLPDSECLSLKQKDIS
jgi:UDPglucose--hexose-1-phosphate uridylyltransferase